MFQINPAGEIFFLCLLLFHTAVGGSFDYLRTINGRIIDTFQETCFLGGLLQDDTEWKNTLFEAVTTQVSRQIRQLFSIILTFCEPVDPIHSWNTFKNFMIGDFICIMLPGCAEQDALTHVEKIISRCGKTFANFNLPSLDEVAQNEDIEVQVTIN